MFARDAQHPDPKLQQKLQQLFSLRRQGGQSAGIRKVYTDLLFGLGDPHHNLPPVIHVAGTNGKGSTIAFMRAMAESAGLRVHVYTSPHLVRFNERIVLQGRAIEDAPLMDLIDEAVDLNAGSEISFFEITTAIAFAAFARTPADLVLLETGMGGLHDCTNVVTRPLLSVITAIGYDHQEFLGSDIEGIALEKAGIIKPSGMSVSGYQLHSGVSRVLRDAASRQGAVHYEAGQNWSVVGDDASLSFCFEDASYRFDRPALQGLHQIQNAGLACAAMTITSQELGITQDDMNRGLTRAFWPARLQNITAPVQMRLGPTPLEGEEIWLDGAHNADGAQALAQTLSHWQKKDPKKLSLLVGMMGHKDAAAFFSAFEALGPDLYAVGIPGEPSARTPQDLASASSRPTRLAADWQSAVYDARARQPGGRLVIAGSLYLAAHVLETLGLAPGR